MSSFFNTLPVIEWLIHIVSLIQLFVTLPSSNLPEVSSNSPLLLLLTFSSFFLLESTFPYFLGIKALWLYRIWFFWYYNQCSNQCSSTMSSAIECLIPIIFLIILLTNRRRKDYQIFPSQIFRLLYAYSPFLLSSMFLTSFLSETSLLNYI